MIGNHLDEQRMFSFFVMDINFIENSPIVFSLFVTDRSNPFLCRNVGNYKDNL